MRKVEADGYFRPDRRQPLGRNAKEGRVLGSGAFLRNLLTDREEVVSEYRYSLESETDVEALLDTVHGLGEQLKKDPRRQTLLDYKDAVRTLLGHIVKHGIEIKEHVSGHNIMRRKRFALVTVIDEKLERLGAGVLRAQRDQIEILRRVDEINGLLVDLLR